MEQDDEVNPEIDDADSTLIRRGRRASSLSDMVEFAKSVHERPLAKVVEELPQIARLSDTKFHVATKILRQRFDTQSAEEKRVLRRIGDDIADSVSSEWVADRIRSIFKPEA